MIQSLKVFFMFSTQNVQVYKKVDWCMLRKQQNLIGAQKLSRKLDITQYFLIFPKEQKYVKLKVKFLWDYRRLNIGELE